MSKVSNELAVNEMTRWLDYKKIKPAKRESNKEQADLIVSCIEEGQIEIDEECNMKFNLNFPIHSDEGDVMLASMIFKPRLKVHEISAKMKGVKATDIDARMAAYISASAQINSGQVRNLDTEDFNVAQAVILYFL